MIDFLLASSEELPQSHLAGIVILFGAALVVAWILRILRGPAILGYLVAGMLIGPHGFALIEAAEDSTGIRFYAELGLVLLLFTVGLELSPAPLLRMGRSLLLAAGLQVGLITAVAGLLVFFIEGMSPAGAAILGLAVALSSTAIVLKHLADRGETDSAGGTIITGILLLQDLVVIMVLILLPFVAQGTGSIFAIGLKLGLALVGLTILIAVARFVMPWIVDAVFSFGGQELMTLFAIVMAATGAWLAGTAGWSWALGSFIAGLLLAQTDVRHQLHADITPFRDAFNALFFMSIGMLVRLDLFVEMPVILLTLILVTLVGKTAITTLAVNLSGWTPRLALVAGLGLSTMSEFAYVLGDNAVQVGMLPPHALDLLIAWTVGTMLIGALLIPVSTPIAAWLAVRLPLRRRADTVDQSDTAAKTGHVLIVGYGINGRNLTRVLRAVRIPATVVEQHRRTAHAAQGEGITILIGDATRQQILESAQIRAARALVISISDPHAVRTIVAQARALCPDIYILARTRHEAEIEALYRLGADEVIPEEFETSIEIFAHVLRNFSIPDNVIEQQVNLVRAGRYDMLRGRARPQQSQAEWLRVLESAVTQTYYVESESPPCGKTIAELDLRKRTGATIVAATRAGKPYPSPSPDFEVSAGDVLVLVGTHHQLDEARHALSGH